MYTENLGYIRACAGVPNLMVGNPEFNIKEIIKAIEMARHKGVHVITFPELCITGYTCGDLFNQKLLLDKSVESLQELIRFTKKIDMFITIGMPIKADNQLFNCAVSFYRGKILGVVPKTYIPNYGEFYEKRNFASSISQISNTINLCEQEVPFGTDLLFRDTNSDLCIGIEICEDLWVPMPPSIYHTQNGANLILNLSASNEVVSKSAYREDLVKMQSAKCITGYVYASAGQSESTTDLVFSGHAMIADNGAILKEMRFENNTSIICADIDIEKLENDRMRINSYMGNIQKKVYRIISFNLPNTNTDIDRIINSHPFVPQNTEKRNERCKEIINIQATGLAQRLKKINVNKAVIGISGGLDSTLALLVTVEAFRKLGLPMNNILGITMPGFGTTNRTYNNSISLMKELGILAKEISIVDACKQHYKDIHHDVGIKDITYENTQARERTQILMDIANKEGGLVVGTGDLSELALGWCTYNADQMSMYGVNSSIPKTLVKYLVKWYAETNVNDKIKAILLDICDTPVSPELLPPDKEGKIAQITENNIGSYDLHDFFLYNMLRNGYSPKKIYALAVKAFINTRGFNEKNILDTLKIFYKRFFTQQFKRSCMPDGAKVGSISLSPRGDLRMPSDASYSLWLNELENI